LNFRGVGVEDLSITSMRLEAAFIKKLSRRRARR
jgi:hypothetical protein